jgi:hypothetical protein
MLMKLVLLAAAVVIIGLIVYLLLNFSLKSDPDPREGIPENDLLKAKNFKSVCEYLLERPDFVDHKEGIFLLITDLATIAQKDNAVYGFKECQKAIDIGYGETKLKLILSDVAMPLSPEGNNNEVGNLLVFSGFDCVLKTKAEVIESSRGPRYRVWTDQEAVTLVQDGSWLGDLQELVRLLVQTDEQRLAGSSMFTSAMMGGAIGIAMNDFDE